MVKVPPQYGQSSLTMNAPSSIIQSSSSPSSFVRSARAARADAACSRRRSACSAAASLASSSAAFAALCTNCATPNDLPHFLRVHVSTCLNIDGR